MQVYAAMVDRLDQNIGHLMAALEKAGIAENTVIFFLSDNGGEAARIDRTPKVEIGSRDSFTTYGRHWASTSSTPYRKHKKYTHEGGTLTPLIAYWPAGFKRPGRITHEPGHIMDLFATVLDIAGVGQPEGPLGAPPAQSLLPVLRGGAADSERPIFLEHEGHQAVRLGNWKLVRSNKQPWELYNLNEDPAETHDRIAQEPERAARLAALYEAWMEANKVRPWPLHE